MERSAGIATILNRAKCVNALPRIPEQALKCAQTRRDEHRPENPSTGIPHEFAIGGPGGAGGLWRAAGCADIGGGRDGAGACGLRPGWFQEKNAMPNSSSHTPARSDVLTLLHRDNLRDTLPPAKSG
jgi:hypothetical protein